MDQTNFDKMINPLKDMRLPFQVLRLIENEYFKAKAKHAPMNSPHEGYAVIKEELEELWDEIKKREPDKLRMKEECVQVGAMAMRFLIDIIGEGVVIHDPAITTSREPYKQSD